MDKLLVLGSVSLSGALLAGVTALICRGMGRRLHARAVYLLWMLVLLRFLCPWTIPQSLLGQAVAEGREQWDVQVSVPLIQEQAPALQKPLPKTVSLEDVLWGLWLTGAGGVLVVRSAGYIRFFRKLACQSRPAPEVIQRDYDALVAPYRRPPRLIVSPQADTPMLVGLVRPCIVLPCLELSREAAQTLLGHELLHWRRRDVAVKWLCLAVTAAHWFNPAVWWVAGRLDRACELSCDEVLTWNWDTAKRARYGELLLSFCAVSGWHGPAFCLSKKRCLKERLVNLMDHRKKPFAGVLAAAACLAVMLSSVALGAYAAPEQAAAGVPNQAAAGKVELQWPLETGESVTLSRTFESRVHPVTGKAIDHSGLDIVLDAGTPVLAAASATVAKTGFDSADGRYIELSHGNVTTKYCHLAEIQAAVGETISAGQTIGTVGQTGMSTGPHLHFEVLENGSPVDPLGLLPHVQVGSAC